MVVWRFGLRAGQPPGVFHCETGIVATDRVRLRGARKRCPSLLPGPDIYLCVFIQSYDDGFDSIQPIYLFDVGIGYFFINAAARY